MMKANTVTSCIFGLLFASPTLAMFYQGAGMHPYGAKTLRKLQQEELNNRLYRAVTDGNNMHAEKALQEGAEVNALYGDSPPLIHAIQWASEDICRLLIQHKADVNYPQYPSPFLLAAGRGNESICRMLIDAGCDISAGPTQNVISAFARALDHPKIQRLICDRQEQLNNSIIISLGCLKRLKKRGDQLGQVLYSNARHLLKPHFAPEKNYRPRQLAHMKGICRKQETKIQMHNMRFVIFSGIVLVLMSYCVWVMNR